MMRQEPRRVIIVVGAASVIFILVVLLLQEPYRARSFTTSISWNYNLWQSGNNSPTPKGNDTTTPKKYATSSPKYDAPAPKNYDAPAPTKHDTPTPTEEEDEDMKLDFTKLYLRRLVKGKDRTQLEETGIKCLYEQHFEQCIIDKPVIIAAKKPLTVYVPSNHALENHTVRPYARRDDNAAMNQVTPVHILHGNVTLPKPSCDVTHDVPAMIFSTGGFVGNLFHETNEILIPLFITSRHFESRLQFIVTDHATWWMAKYKEMLQHLSFPEVLNGDADGRVHCFPGAVVGLRFHGNIALNDYEIPIGYTMTDFKHFLAEAYKLKMYAPLKLNDKPKILLFARQKSRAIVNEGEMIQMMEKMGCEVRLALAEETIYVANFSKVVNSHDIIVGVHGAGLTNQVFLRKGGVVIQVVLLTLEWASEYYFGHPAEEGGLKYIEYKAEPKESSLYDVYGANDPAVRDPAAFVSKKGYAAGRAAYLDGQNVTINLARFNTTLVEALQHLGYLTP